MRLLAATPASLEPIFNRHRATAEQLLGFESERFAEFVITRVKRSDRAQLLQSLPETLPITNLLQDAVVSFGEILSSTLMAAVLNQRGIEARQVDARRCIITDDEHTCAAPLLRGNVLAHRERIAPACGKRSRAGAGWIYRCDVARRDDDARTRRL